MIKVIRYKYNSYHITDIVYKDGKQITSPQSNLVSKNRFGAKKFKCDNGSILAVNSWEWGDIKE